MRVSTFIIDNFNFIVKNNSLFLYNVKCFLIINVVKYFKNKLNHSYNYLVDLFVCDYVYYISRFRITYNFTSFKNNSNLYLNISIKLLEKYISLYIIFKSSVWLEREAYDMFGIIFYNNWDLRKILTDYTFFGFPLRKDFPLSGFMEIFYDLRKKSISEVLIELMQEFRFYIISSYIEFWDQEI